MLAQLSGSLTSVGLFAYAPPTLKQTIAYVLVALVCSTAVGILLWRVPIEALFRKPIELAGECPHCGSKDIRNSRVQSDLDRLRGKIGLLPFRCRGCTRRFFRRSNGDKSRAIQPLSA